jgi:EpsI family protein
VLYTQLLLSPRAQRTLGVASLVVAALAYRELVFWDPASILLPPVQAWLVLPTGTSPRLILVLVAALLIRRRERLRAAMRDRGSPGLAILPLGVGFASFVWGQHTGAGDLILVSFAGVSLGAGLLCFGVRFARALLLPLVVLLFAIPLPAVLANQAFYFLQVWIARHATALLSLLGFSLFREGNVIYGSDGVTMVIDSCSGLRFIEILTLIAIVYVAWFPARRARGVLLVALAPAIAYAFNLVRACLLVLNPTSELSELHTLQGLLVFPGAVLCLVLADRLLRHLLPTVGRRGETAPAQEPRGTTRSGGASGALALAILLVILLGVSVWMPRWNPPEKERPVSIGLPLEIEGWRQGRRLALDQLFLATLQFSTYTHRLFLRDDERVSVFVGQDDRTLRDRSLISPKNAFPSGGWEVEEWSSVRLDPCGARVERVLARSGTRRLLSYHWYEGADGLALETLRAALSLDRSRFARREPARVVRVATEFRPEPAALARAEARLPGLACSLGAAQLVGRQEIPFPGAGFRAAAACVRGTAGRPRPPWKRIYFRGDPVFNQRTEDPHADPEHVWASHCALSDRVALVRGDGGTAGRVRCHHRDQRASRWIGDGERSRNQGHHGEGAAREGNRSRGPDARRHDAPDRRLRRRGSGRQPDVVRAPDPRDRQGRRWRQADDDDPVLHFGIHRLLRHLHRHVVHEREHVLGDLPHAAEDVPVGCGCWTRALDPLGSRSARKPGAGSPLRFDGESGLPQRIRSPARRAGAPAPRGLPLRDGRSAVLGRGSRPGAALRPRPL